MEYLERLGIKTKEKKKPYEDKMLNYKKKKVY